MFENIQRGTLGIYIPNDLGTTIHAKCHITTCTLRSYGLGCQQLGLHCYTCNDHHYVHGCFAFGGIISHPAPLLCNLERITVEHYHSMGVRYVHLIELIFGFLMVFILYQSDIY